LEKFGQKKNFDVEKKSFLFSKNAKKMFLLQIVFL